MACWSTQKIARHTQIIIHFEVKFFSMHLPRCCITRLPQDIVNIYRMALVLFLGYQLCNVHVCFSYSLCCSYSLFTHLWSKINQPTESSIHVRTSGAISSEHERNGVPAAIHEPNDIRKKNKKKHNGRIQDLECVMRPLAIMPICCVCLFRLDCVVCEILFYCFREIAVRVRASLWIS